MDQHGQFPEEDLFEVLFICPWCEKVKAEPQFSPEFPEWHKNCLGEFKATLMQMAKNYKVLRL